MNLESVIEQISEIKATLQKIFDKARGINELDEGNGMEDGMLSAVYSPSLKKTIKMPYSSIELDEELNSDSETIALNLKGAKKLSFRDGVHKEYLTHTSLFSNQSEQIKSLLYFLEDASSHPLVVSGYAYFEYLGTTNEDWTDYRLISKQIIVEDLEFKLFCKTNSQDSNWEIFYLNPVQDMEYVIVDNSTGVTIKTGTGKVEADLTTSSGDVSVYLKVDDSGLGVTKFNSYYGRGKFTYIDFSVFPNLEGFKVYGNSNVTQTVGDLNNLKNLFLWSGNYPDLDFSSVTTLESVVVYSNTVLGNVLDVSNSPNLKKYISFVFSSSFNVSNHRDIEYLQFKGDANNGLDTNINNTYLTSLTTLNLLSNGYYDLDLNSRDLSGIQTLSIKLNTVSGFNTMSSLKVLDVKSKSDLTFAGLSSLENLKISEITNAVLDLKPLVSLKVFDLVYANHPNLTQVLIDNNLNSNITRFRRLYVSQGYSGGGDGIVDVKVDNPTNANSGVSPYLPSVWQKQYNGYDVFNFV